MAALLVSDIHLTPARPDIERLFRHFLLGPVHGAEALYILGDLFEYWAGDDDLEDDFNARVVRDLASCSESGVPIYFMRGNRDFLVSAGFAQAAGVTLLPDPSLVALYGRSVLLTHGDELCTDDTSYQQFRRKVRSAEWIESFLARPLAERRQEIERLRALSEAEKRSKPAAIMDVNTAAVEELLRGRGYPTLVHGHTHRPGRHEYRVDGHRCERWVLAAWYERGSCIVADQRGLHREDIVYP